MQGSEMREIRRQLGMDRLAFAALIGYTGTPRNNEDRLRKMENGRQQIPLPIARFVWLLGVWRRRYGEEPPFPDWPGYEFDHSPDEEVQDA